MAEACEVGWSWEERKRLAPNLEAGRRYSVVINGEHLAQFVAK